MKTNSEILNIDVVDAETVNPKKSKFFLEEKKVTKRKSFYQKMNSFFKWLKSLDLPKASSNAIHR